MNSTRWGVFQVSDLFKVDERGKRLTEDNRERGLTPLVTAGFSNNGINSFINNIEQKTYYNAITIDMFGNVFYQPYNFKCDDNITVIQHKNLNKSNALFLLTAFKHLTNKYSYAYQLRPNRIARDIINLPITENNDPDWEYMGKCIEGVKTNSNEKLVKYLKSELNKVRNFKETNIQEKEWRSFKISELFYIKRGKRLIKSNQEVGSIPYISSTSLNNGVDNFISDKMSSNSFRQFNNCITIANSGSVGSSFYHSYNFIGSDHVTSLNCDYLNEYIALFIITSLKKISDKYSFNREINDTRMSNEKIMLPVNEKGILDLDFMENYIKKIKFNSIIKTLNFMENN